MTMRIAFSRLLFAAALTAPLAAMAAPTYKIKVVGPAGSAARGMNGYGQVVGSMPSGDYTHAFVYNGTKWVDLGTLGGTDSDAYAINDSGAVVGWASTSSGHYHAFSYWRGRITDLGTLDGGDTSLAMSINNAGVIVGQSNTADRWYGFRYQSGLMQNMGTLPGGNFSIAEKINSKGAIVGEANDGQYEPDGAYPVIFNGSTKTQISKYLGFALGINYYGAAVGGLLTYDLPSPRATRAFLYDSGRVTYLGSLDSSFDDAMAVAINNVGQVIGYSQTSSGYRAFIYTAREGIRDLNTLVDTSTGWEVISADAINDNRQIAGTACNSDMCYAVRLDPVTP
jgi:probable HAF family extracellular repeat protein